MVGNSGSAAVATVCPRVAVSASYHEALGIPFQWAHHDCPMCLRIPVQVTAETEIDVDSDIISISSEESWGEPGALIRIPPSPTDEVFDPTDYGEEVFGGLGEHHSEGGGSGDRSGDDSKRACEGGDYGHRHSEDSGGRDRSDDSQGDLGDHGASDQGPSVVGAAATDPPILPVIGATIADGDAPMLDDIGRLVGIDSNSEEQLALWNREPLLQD